MSGHANILEIIDPENSFLQQRTHKLGNVQGLGPPDVCYYIREHAPSGLRKLVSKSYTRSYYCYLYGANTTSQASIAAYFRSLLDNTQNRKSNIKVISGTFCVFDLFSKYDIRVEIQIPGHTSAYLINSNGQHFKPEEVHWQGAFLSSILRSIYPIRSSAVSFNNPFECAKDIEEFLDIAERFWDKLGFVLGDLDDTAKYGVNLLFPALSKYLTKLKRYKIHQSLFKKYIEKDPLMLTFLGKSSVKIGKFEEIIRLVSNQIKITPHAFPLYFTLAKAHLKKQEIGQAIKLCQYLIELNLEVYDYWHLLIVCYIKKKDYAAALLFLNVMPHYITQENTETIEVPEEKVVLPEKISFKAAGNIWITPKELDFRAFEDQLLSRTSKEKEVLRKLNNLPALKLNGSKLRAYKLLVKIEKEIEWENLLRLKSSILKKTTSTVEEEEKIHTQMLSSQGPTTESNKYGFNRSLYPTFSQEISPEIDSYIDEGIHPAQTLTTRNYFLPESGTNSLALVMNVNQRIQSTSLSELFTCLHNDLKAVYEWQKESSDIQAVHALKNSNLYIEAIPYNGELWLRRGILSERLMKNRLAERAYRYVVDKGFSLFAWYRLMKVYVKGGNPKAVLVCIMEVVKQLEQENIIFDGIPIWMEEVLGDMCRGCGYKQILSLSSELNLERFRPITNAIEKLQYWCVDGVKLN